MADATILYLNHVSYLGGAEIALLNLLEHLNCGRYTPVVLAPAGELAEAVRRLDVRWVQIPVLDGLNRYTLPRFLSRLPLLTACVRRERPTLLHANTNFTAEYAGVLARGLKLPTVGHIRDIEPFGRLGRWTIRQNTCLIAISGAVQRFLLDEQAPARQIVRVYDGVDLRHYQPNEAPTGRQTNVVIGIVGQIGRRKGHLVLFEAFRNLTTAYPALRLWVVGQEPAHSHEHYTEELRRYVDTYHLEDRITFWGFHADIPALLAQLDLVVLPSLQEPFGKIVIEAMAMGKPVVASSVGGVPEIVEHGKTGLLIPPDNTDALRQALEQLVLNPDMRCKMGQVGQKRVRHLFSLQHHVQAIERVYATMLRQVSPKNCKIR